MSTRSSLSFAAMVLIFVIAATSAQEPAGPGGAAGLLDAPKVVGTGAERARVVPLKGFNYPWALAFLPNGDILVTERPGRLRLVHNFVLDPQPISGIPDVLDAEKGGPYRGLMDVALHPNFAQNQLVYFTYTQAVPEPATSGAPPVLAKRDRLGAPVLARGRYDGNHALTEVRDLFVSNARTSGTSAARIAFGRDGKVFMVIGIPSRDKARGGPNRVGSAEWAQDPASHAGKVLRLNDDGTVPTDNPFVGRPEYKPEIFALGIRNATGLIVHPQTGQLWDVEHGPQGGDEVNIIAAGRNYGWPVISMGRAYSGDTTMSGSGPELPEPCAPGMEQPFIFWVPIIAPGGMTLYTGDRFPAWKGNLLVGGLRSAALHRVTLNNRGLPTGRATLFADLNQRIREVRQGPDNLVYLLTDDEAGALLRLEPVQ